MNNDIVYFVYTTAEKFKKQNIKLDNCLYFVQEVNGDYSFFKGDKEIKVASGVIKDEIAKIIDNAPGELDTLKELAEAFKGNKKIIDKINEAIIKKASKDELNKAKQEIERLSNNLSSSTEQILKIKNKYDNLLMRNQNFTEQFTLAPSHSDKYPSLMRLEKPVITYRKGKKYNILLQIASDGFNPKRYSFYNQAFLFENYIRYEDVSGTFPSLNLTFTAFLNDQFIDCHMIIIFSENNKPTHYFTYIKDSTNRIYRNADNFFYPEKIEISEVLDYENII